MAAKWFVMKADRVEGPFSTDHVHTSIEATKISSSDLIWGMGMTSWQPVAWWQTQVTQLEAEATNPKTNVEDQDQEAWHFAIDGKSVGPLSRKALLNDLKNVKNIANVSLWTKGMKEWSPIFDFHDILTELGVNKREVPRAEIDAKAVVRTSGITLVAQAFSISETGLGLRLDAGLVSGQNAQVEIQCSAFPQPISTKVEVRYQFNGCVGLRFTSISAESRAIIAQYVKMHQNRFLIKAA